MVDTKHTALRKCVALCIYLFLIGCTGDTGISSSTSNSSQSYSISSESISSLSSSSSLTVTSSSAASSLDVSGGIAYQNADGIKGGQLYAEFWAAETGFTLQNSNLSAKDELALIKNNPAFFSCAHCHGWDQLGQVGGNSNLAPSFDSPRVADLDLAKLAETASPKTLFDGIKFGTNRRSIDDNLADYNPATSPNSGDSMPAYDSILTDGQIWNIVKFLKEEILETTALYELRLFGSTYPRIRGFDNWGVDGSELAGKDLFASQCADCHGADGTEVLLDGGVSTLGKFMRTKAYIAQHKVKFGHLGSVMGPVLKDASLGDIQDLFAAIANKEAFPDTKPEPEPEPQIIDGEEKFWHHCSSCHSGNGAGASSPRFGDVTGASADLINFKVQTVPEMNYLRPDNTAQFVTLEEVDAIAEFLQR